MTLLLEAKRNASALQNNVNVFNISTGKYISEADENGYGI